MMNSNKYSSSNNNSTTIAAASALTTYADATSPTSSLPLPPLATPSLIELLFARPSTSRRASGIGINTTSTASTTTTHAFHYSLPHQVHSNTNHKNRLVFNNTPNQTLEETLSEVLHFLGQEEDTAFEDEYKARQDTSSIMSIMPYHDFGNHLCHQQ